MFQLFRPPRWIDRLYPACTWRFFISRPVVFLTFDDGPHPDITPFVLDQLAKHNMKATFFCVGENMKRYPEIVDTILANGHAIGNHTMRHTKGSAVNDAAYFESVNDFQEVYPATLFRPPYGKTRRSQRKKLAAQFQLIMWSWLSYDFDPRVPVARILRKAGTIRSGDIIVLHDNPKIAERQRELLPALLELLDKKGLGSEVIAR
jgi:peptidoglycan/xylan/chitin deacetylase (PgdA/CDA1 family)